MLNATNATRSAVLMSFWTPDTITNRFAGMDYEIVLMHLPMATQSCLDTCTTSEERCSKDFDARMCTKEGSSDIEAYSY